MNLSPTWVERFQIENWDSVHWSSVGDGSATDREILDWASDHGYVVFTHDLDFGNLLASKRQDRPSIIQLRGQETSPAMIGDVVVLAVRRVEQELERGALISIDARGARVRILPLRN